MQPSKSEKDALIALFRARRYAEACRAARAMTRRYPKALDGWNIRGAAARELGQLMEAEKSFRELEGLAPTFAGAPYNLGLVLENKGADAEAAQAYLRALALDPDMAQAHNNLGTVRARLGEYEAALDHLTRATQLQPGWPEVHNSLGNLLKRLGRAHEARAAYGRALEARPDFVNARYNLGVLESELGHRTAAIEAFEAVLNLQPDHALARAMILHDMSQLCDWEGMAAHSGWIAKLGVETEAVPPFAMIPLEDHPERHFVRAQNWAAARFGRINDGAAPKGQPSFRPSSKPLSRPQRLRVGYLGADFHDHPGMRLMAGMLREHDRSRFEVHAISYGRLRDDKWRAMSQRVVDHFHDVHGWSDAAVLDLVRDLKLDIAIDRKGYSTDTRSELFARRLAPVQINYLGYPATMAAPFMDYMVADETIIPSHQRAYYGEKIIWLPQTYMPADNALEIAPAHSSRADHGLPDSALVLCCFNAPYKITPEVFAIWMRVLSRFDDSVLWLYANDENVRQNLRAAAAKAGVDPARLVFAARLPNADHLERHAHADLFLDTAPCNAHTTTNDALWAGLPVVTRSGEQLAARVAASLLKAVGLPQLITTSDADYEALIVELASERARLRGVRDHLLSVRSSAPLFDTVRYTRHLEAGYDAAFERVVKGLPPADINVALYTGQKG